MMIANALKRAKFGADSLYEVARDGTLIATINESKGRFDFEGVTYQMVREGGLVPTHVLKAGDSVVAKAAQKPMFNYYTLTCGGKEWIFKAIGMMAQKFGLYDGEQLRGSIASGGFMSRLKNITVDLPAELPEPVQLFLLLILVRNWTDPG